MSFDSREKSLYQGQPVECYRFVLGATTYLWTSADVNVVLPTGTYTPAVIGRTELDLGDEAFSGNLTVTVPIDSPVVAPFMPYVPGAQLIVTIFRAHRGEESLAVPIFLGSMISIAAKDESASFLLAPMGESLNRKIPLLTYQPLCNWALYGAGCGVLVASFTDTVVLDSVSGVTVVAAAFASRPNGWYRNGYFTDPGGELRMIVNHVGNTLTLISPYAALAAGQTVKATAGCDRLKPTCKTKFNNYDRFFGFPDVPQTNPFVGTVV